MRYLGSIDGTIASTKCRRARRSCWRLIAGRGGGRAANLPGGLRWRSGASLLRAGGGTSTEERESGRDGVERSAARSAGVGGCVGAGSGRGCRVAGDAGAWSPRGESALTRSARARAASGSRGTVRDWAEA